MATIQQLEKLYQLLVMKKSSYLVFIFYLLLFTVFLILFLIVSLLSI